MFDPGEGARESASDQNYRSRASLSPSWRGASGVFPTISELAVTSSIK